MTAIDIPPASVPRLEWRLVEVREIVIETPRAKSLVLDVPGWGGHLPGQHVDIRLTAEDGYQAQRSYSIASPSAEGSLTLTVEKIHDGEVSPYLVDELRVGDRFELRGPIGGHFVWSGAKDDPLSLLAGGSGIVPLMAMLRHRHRENISTPAVLLYSSRSLEDVIYRKELDALARATSSLRVVTTLTRKQPDRWVGHRGRVDHAMLAQVSFPPEKSPKNYVCGPTAFVEDVSRLLVELGHDSRAIKTERFGPSGG
jgi:ferredoxin-NADP reductase